MIARRVAKIGGSLLDWPDLRTRLRAWLERQPASLWLTIVGGGKLADALRDSWRLHGLDGELAHWLCIRAMGLHAEMLGDLLPGARGPSPLEEILAAPDSPGVWLVDPYYLLRHEEPAFVSRPLPASWDVTSDSIAARLAELAGATECVLLKSALPAEGASIATASEQGYVDAWFPRACPPGLRVRCVNLRDAAWPEAILADGRPGRPPLG